MILMLMLLLGVNRSAAEVRPNRGRRRRPASLAWVPQVAVRYGTSSAASDLVEPETNEEKAMRTGQIPIS